MSGSTIPEVYVVDVCGTLVRDDTTLGLLRYHFAQSSAKRWRSALLWVLISRKSPCYWALAVFEKLTGRHLLKYVAASLLAGDAPSALEASAQGYAAELLNSRRVAVVSSRLANADKQVLIILASASLEPVVKSIAELMGVQYVASTLSVQDGVYTGRYNQDITGLKEAALLAKFGEGVLSRPFLMVSDNLSDRELMSKATEACVVLHHPSHRERWQGLSADFVSISD